MSRQNSNKKHAKRIARRERVTAKERRLGELTLKHEFPDFVFEPNDAPPEFVEAIRVAVQSVDFRDASTFRDWERETYRRIKQVGAGRALAELDQSVAKSPDPRVMRMHFTLNLGHTVL